MAKSKTKVEKISEEESNTLSLERSLAEIRKRFDTGRLPKNPTRKFNVGDRVQIGAWGETHIVEIIDDGLIYKVHADFMGSSYGKPVREIKDDYYEWVEILPYVSKEENNARPVLVPVNDVCINFYKSSIKSLLQMVYSSGVEFKPDYQRDFVWDLLQKTELLDSIFNHIEIGKFTFIRHDYSRDKIYEILDGKQRLSTLCEFYEDRFSFRGKKFSEMSYRDKHHFTGFSIMYGDTENLTQKQIYGLFLKLNISGRPASQEHLEKVKQLYKSA